MVARKKIETKGKGLVAEQRGGGSGVRVAFLCFEWGEQQRNLPGRGVADWAGGGSMSGLFRERVGKEMMMPQFGKYRVPIFKRHASGNLQHAVEKFNAFMHSLHSTDSI